MITKKDLMDATIDFFNAYCNKELFEKFPEWSTEWYFKGEVPYNSEKGCYAHLNDNKVIYIGLAISDSNKGSGIGSRVSNYWKFDSTKNGIKTYKPTKEEITSIITIPFKNNTFYIAAALEVYLIQNLIGLNNKTHSKKG